MTTPNFKLQRDVVADNTLSTAVSSVYSRAQIVSRVTTPNAVNATPADPIATSVLFGGIITSTSAAAVTVKLPTAASTIAALPGYKVGDTFSLSVVNTGPNTVTLSNNGDANITAVGVSGVLTATSATFLFTITSPTTLSYYRATA